MWDTDFFLCLPQERWRLQSQVRPGVCVLCVQGAAAVWHMTQMENPSALFWMGSASWGLFPSLTSLFLLTVVASRKQDRANSCQTQYIWHKIGALTLRAVWFYFYDVSVIYFNPDLSVGERDWRISAQMFHCWINTKCGKEYGCKKHSGA